MAISFKVDTREFDRTLKKYTQFSKRDIPVICNTKAFYIARRATKETKKASEAKIERAMNKRVKTQFNVTGFKVRFTKTKGVRRGKAIGEWVYAPLGALLVNAQRAREGLKGCDS